jgi:paraquat-inducible protein A
MGDATESLHVCVCCGLTQQVPAVPAGWRTNCARCGAPVGSRRVLRSNSRTAAIAAAALILYPFGAGLPMLTVERFGFANETSILTGIASLFGSGQLVVGIVVLLCSVVFPLGKLFALLALSAGALRSEHRGITYRLVEWTGRWGMLDVLLVAVLVAVLKLGDAVDVTIGPAAVAFAACVVLSLLAAATFDPRSLWKHDA